MWIGFAPRSRQISTISGNMDEYGEENGDAKKQVLMDLILQVEPQEKKKTPKGRAKKRIEYTRRFVNVTLTGGKRKVGIILRFTAQVTVSDQCNR